MSNLIDRFKGAFSHIAKARGQWHETAPAEEIETSLAPDQLAKLASALSGSYRIEKEVGEGGMALVFRARESVRDRGSCC